MFLKDCLEKVKFENSLQKNKQKKHEKFPIMQRVKIKPVLSGHSKIDKTKVLKTNGSLMKVEGIAECCNTFDLH